MKKLGAGNRRQRGKEEAITSFASAAKEDKPIGDEIEGVRSPRTRKATTFNGQSSAGKRTQLGNLSEEAFPRKTLPFLRGEGSDEGVDTAAAPLPPADGLPHGVRRGQRSEASAGHREGEDGVHGEEQQQGDDVIAAQMGCNRRATGRGGSCRRW